MLKEAAPLDSFRFADQPETNPFVTTQVQGIYSKNLHHCENRSFERILCADQRALADRCY